MPQTVSSSRGLIRAPTRQLGLLVCVCSAVAGLVGSLVPVFSALFLLRDSCSEAALRA